MAKKPSIDRHSPARVGSGYPRSQLAKALQNASATGTPESEQKASKWQQVLEGLFSGQLAVGSRTPVIDTPAWVTPEVITGGFATGSVVAGGELRAHELKLAEDLGLPVDAQTRATLNGYFLSQEGQDRLFARLESGTFRFDAPEEGALLVVSWLLRNQGVAEAQRILDAITPYFDRLRFFPEFQASPGTGGEEVFLQTAETTARVLRAVSPQRRLDAQEETIRVWAPLYDESVRLLLATVEGARPQVEVDSDGKPVRNATGSYTVSGGLPLQKKPEGWDRAAHELLEKYRENAIRHRLAKRWHKRAAPFQRFLFAIDTFSRSESPSASEASYLRMALGRYLAKRDALGTESHVAIRAAQAETCAKPRHHEVAELLAKRLDALPKGGGIRDVDTISRPIQAEESTEHVPPGTAAPRHLLRKVGRAQIATLSVLIDERYITSGDVLAEVLPQLSSEIRAAALPDAKLRRVYAHIYRAFRKRRSLLLLNLESQVRIDELPWVAALSGYRQRSLEEKELAATVLREVLSITLTNFPYAILPNTLLQEARALVKQAGLDIPIVDEVAADIFMGVFSPKFARAAQLVGPSLRDSVYARYYGIDFAALNTLATKPKRVFADTRKPGLLSTLLGRKSASGADDSAVVKTFSDLCATRADRAPSSAHSVASKAVVIEQQQILTTQNLGTLFLKADLGEALRPVLPEMVKTTFRWICRRQQMRLNNHHAALVMLKNTAYAWRQLIFYLSQLTDPEQHDLLIWMRRTLAEQTTEFQERFAPALQGLENAAAGKPVNSESGRVFLGWTTRKHWLMPEATQSASTF